ncbi:hypothetical protein BDN70DRAFT_949571 [Pholiota conissans]|uniref:G domain-containing protein n=1 Tax=Pholiota conissans TaxID=109636 RepID=A0A9P6D682_9AGAR|nr:hypothetical protein BDN70DRAFT_949571 [Pholiota conissans]
MASQMNKTPLVMYELLLLGETGAGKSTFIVEAIRANAKKLPRIGHGLCGCTQEVEIYEAKHPTNPAKLVRLVDTPGFNDESMEEEDRDKLGKIIEWLKRIYNVATETRPSDEGPIFVIYLLDITQPRLETAPSATMGAAKIPPPRGVMLVTTKWIDENDQDPVKLSHQRDIEDCFEDCEVEPFYKSGISAWEVLDHARSLESTQREQVVAKLETVRKNLTSVSKNNGTKVQRFAGRFIALFTGQKNSPARKN